VAGLADAGGTAGLGGQTAPGDPAAALTTAAPANATTGLTGPTGPGAASAGATGSDGSAGAGGTVANGAASAGGPDATVADGAPGTGDGAATGGPTSGSAAPGTGPGTGDPGASGAHGPVAGPSTLNGLHQALQGTAQPASAVAQVDGPTWTGPTPPSSAVQLAVRILPLREAPDGTHRLTVHLHPAELGPVSLVAEVRDGALRLQLTGETEAAHHALRDALPELRQELAQAGLRDCTLDLRQQAPGSGPGQQWTAAPNRERSTQDRPVEQPPEPTTVRAGDRTGHLDLHV
jgi:hypothetical protein